MRKNLGKWLLVWPPQAYLLFFFLVPALIMLFASFRFPGDYGGLAPWMYSEDGQTVYDLSVENYTRLTESWVYLQLFVKSFGYAWSPPWPACCSPTRWRPPSPGPRRSGATC